MTPLHDWAVVQTFGGISTTKLVLINCCNILIQWTLNISQCFMYHKCGSWPKDNRDRTRGIFSKLCKLNPTHSLRNLLKPKVWTGSNCHGLPDYGSNKDDA